MLKALSRKKVSEIRCRTRLYAANLPLAIHSSGTTRPGDPWLKSVLGQAAIAASRSKDTYLAARYRRVMARRGRKRALVALQHSILIAVWHMFTNDTTYHDLGANYFIERAGKASATRRLIGQLNHLGYQVTLNPLAVT